MPSEEKNTRRGTAATVVASAAVTVAIGVTVAALGGYIAPRPPSESPPTAPASFNVAESAAKADPPAVVLVPVTQGPPKAPVSEIAPSADPEPMFAAFGHDDDDEEHEHHARGHEQRWGDD